MILGQDVIAPHKPLQSLAFEPAGGGGFGDVAVVQRQESFDVGNGKTLDDFVFGLIIG